jgi:uncharacterized repeat protein (TIGR04076 family)
MALFMDNQKDSRNGKSNKVPHPINTTAEVEVEVTDIRGHCNFGYKIGDSIQFGSRCIKGEICPEAMLTLWPKVYAIKHRAQFIWDTQTDRASLELTTPCPDPYNPVWFKFRVKSPSTTSSRTAKE